MRRDGMFVSMLLYLRGRHFIFDMFTQQINLTYGTIDGRNRAAGASSAIFPRRLGGWMFKQLNAGRGTLPLQEL